MPPRKQLPNSSPQSRPGSIATSRAIGRGALGNTQDVNVTNDELDVNVTNNFTGGLDVNIQDQYSSPLILPLAQQLGFGELAADAVPNSYAVELAAVGVAAVGQHIRIINSANDRYYWGTVLGITGTTVSLDTPVDFAYTAGSEVTFSNTNMALDGSGTPVHFHLRTGTPSIPSAVDITRMIMVCECSSAVDLNKFGDLAVLTRGLVFRKEEDDVIHNIWNVKSNRDMVGMAFEWDPYVATNPAQGIHGFAWRLTFNGQNKLGVAIRVSQFGQLGMLVQDNISGLTSLTCVVEGHVVEDPTYVEPPIVLPGEVTHEGEVVTHLGFEVTHTEN